MQRQILIGFVLTLIVVIFIPLYWATEPGRQEAARERLKAEATERGAHLYAQHCARCHGREGEGRMGPALKESPLDDKVFWKIVARGVAGKRMPAFGEEDDGPLKTHQIDDLIVFVRNWDPSLVASLSHERPAEGHAPAPTPAPTGSPTAAAAGASGISLDEIEYDPGTPESVLRSGGQVFRSSCAAADCHELPTVEAIRGFDSDDELLETLTIMTEEAELPTDHGEQVIRYLLAVRHGTAPPLSEEEQSSETTQEGSDEDR